MPEEMYHLFDEYDATWCAEDQGWNTKKSLARRFTITGVIERLGFSDHPETKRIVKADNNPEPARRYNLIRVDISPASPVLYNAALEHCLEYVDKATVHQYVLSPILKA